MDQRDGIAPMSVQPWLHELAICVNGNVTALSGPDGQMVGAGAQGLFVDDRRILGLLTVTVGDHEAIGVASNSSGDRSEFLASARHLGSPGPDPAVEVRRRRVIVASGLAESIAVTSRCTEPLATQLEIRLGGDGAPIDQVKAGLAPLVIAPAVGSARTVEWADEWHAVSAQFDPPPQLLTPAQSGDPTIAAYSIVVPAGGTVELLVRVTARALQASNLDAGPGSETVTWDDVALRATDLRMGWALTAAVRDVRHLLLTDPREPSDVFAAAGTPWYLTLFGRDSLWSARMMLPFGTDLAAGTLRTLARRQGLTFDERRAEAPGKIPHEVRRSQFSDPASGLSLPADYYGTIDATPLWITLLHDAWRWGMPRAEVEALLPALQAATRWLTDYSTPDDDGLLKYRDDTGTGLANQGWKDSGDSIRWRDGSIADSPIALVEAQGYAVEAANSAATLYDAFGLPGAAALRTWGVDLAGRIRDRFWIGNGPDRHLGIAVDGKGRTVDGIASNMGHLLGTGALTADEASQVVARLTSPEMLGDYGIRTLASDNGGFNPLGYHTGSVWTHDTAICAWGMAREGHGAAASAVANTLLASAASFDYRWPELYAGGGVPGRPAPYPASCRPQAWAAASAALLVAIALGFEPDAPQQRLTLRPARPASYGAMAVHGLRLAGQRFSVETGADGGVRVIDAPEGLDIQSV